MGKRFVYDRHTATPFEIDKLTWDVLELAGELDRREIVNRLGGTYPHDEVEGVLSSLDGLESDGELFARDEAGDSEWESDIPVGTMILQISHACNLRCKYCYADSGSYGGPTELMSKEVGERAIDFLIDNSGNRDVLEVTFFGGEPLLNFSLVKHLVEYAREKDTSKKFKFSMTTNGTLLTAQVSEWLSDNGFSLIVSLDGPEEIHDEVRVYPSGGGSHRTILENAKKAAALPIGKRTTMRGTVSSRCLDISKQTDYLFDQGFKSVSVEPAVGGPDDAFAVQEKDLPRLTESYKEFARSYLQRIRNGHSPRFFHFFRILERLQSGIPRTHVCGAGSGYLAVSPNGDIYPCHKLDGQSGCKIGSVFSGIEDERRAIWRDTIEVDSNEICRSCWAKYLCGGRCRAYSVLFCDDIMKPLPITCELMKTRIESAIWLYSELGERTFRQSFSHRG